MNKVSFRLTFAEALEIGVKNAPSIIGCVVLWLLTIWVPYINVGTTIAINMLPIELAKGGVISPLGIFDAKYRKYMGDFLITTGLMIIPVFIASLFMIVPGIVLSIAWSLAYFFLFEKKKNPMQAISASNEATYGSKWTMFFVLLAFVVAAYVIAGIFAWICAAIDVGFITFVVLLALVAVIMSISFTDKFTSAGTYSQTFSIQPYQYEFDIYNKLFSAGTTLVPVVIKKNHQEIGEVSFNQTIIPNMNPTFSRTQPSSRNVGKLAPNVDYQWTLVFNENPGTTSGTGLSTGPSKSINHGTTVTIPVPDGFVVNAEESAKLSSSTDFKWTVSQTGDRVIFVNHGGNSSNNSIVLVGHFTNELLDVDQQLTAKEKVSIIQETGNGQQLKAQLPPFSDKLMRKKDDNPEGVSLNGNVYGAFGRSPYEKYPEGQVPLSNNPTEIVFWKYEVGNVSAFNLKNVTVNITLPDGMKATKLRLPSMYNDGEITYTLHRYVDANHPDEITTGVIGQADQILDFSNLAGHVRSIQLTLASLGAGVDYTASSYSTSDGFRVYGYVDQYYDNGKPVNVGDRLTSNLTFGTGTKGWHGDQYVVAKKTQPIKMHVNGFDDNRLPGANGAGYLQLWWDSVAQNADFANPIIYYVLPTNASFNNYYPINKNCKISSYKASDGRTIVKVQYLNTTNKDFRDGSLDYLYLNNQADLPNSFSDYKVFVVTPNGMQVSGQSKVQNADLKYVRLQG